ncbi:MAG TPA: diacylglycerol kinase family protein [Mycobacteriales bacterium]|nr:diacylglycerol kinase family protein [Mycobacteriales bacterium]
MHRRVQVVVNPSAGGGRAAKVLPSVEAALRGAGHDVVVTPTRSLEHTDDLVADALADDRVVAAMGGDGLVGRAAAAVADAGGLLTIVPGGRGNDFCRATGVPCEPLEAVALVADGEERRIDLGVVTSASGTVPFLGIASVGFDSEVQERVLRTRLPLGSQVYTYGALATVATWRHARFDVEVDGAPLQVHGWSVAVSNSGRYGGGMRLAPDASVEDGRLDVVTTSATSRLRFLRSFPKVFEGTHVHDPSVDVRPAREVRLAADRPFRVFADGDPVGVLPCTVSVRPGAVRVLLPRA